MVQNKAFVALSGGVDSSVCALLLQRQGFEVVGITGKMTKSFGADIIVQNAKNVAEKLGIAHVVLDVSDEFQKNVIDYFENSYNMGETPNPCIVCNKFIKWGKIFDYAMENGANVFATGHYADIKNIDGIFKLYPAKDLKKDQLYFLFDLDQNHLSKTIFPLYDYEKSQIRKIAEENDLPSKSSKESQDICFIQKPMTTKKYLFDKIKSQRGNFIDVNTGEKLGEHDGFFQFTIGQRKGIGIAAERPLYVVGIDAEKNEVYIGFEEDNYSDNLILKNVNWSYPQAAKEFDAMVKVRYNMQSQKAHIQILDNAVKIEFYTPVSSLTTGQAVVLYDCTDGHLLGGGFYKI